MHLHENMPIHIDTDSEEWGRVCGRATVITDFPEESRAVVRVQVSGTYAEILVPHADVHLREGVAA